MAYTKRLDLLRQIVGNQPTLLFCKWGHDHSNTPVKARTYPKRSPGSTPGNFFHCENHAVERRAGDWITYANASAAGENGTLLPCAICFAQFAEAINRAITQKR